MDIISNNAKMLDKRIVLESQTEIKQKVGVSEVY